MKVQSIQGAMTALITPFKNNIVDSACYEKLIKRQIAQGIDAIIPVGTTGESATLSHKEHKQCIEIAVATCKGTNTKVIAGAGSNATSEAVDLAKHAQSVGADAILSVTPYYNKPTQDGLYEHYKAVAKSVDMPIVLYNVPSRTGADLEADTAIRLFDDFANIYAIKEATGDLHRCVELLAKRPEFRVFSGDDMIDYPMLSNGASGIISVTSNLLPNLKSELTHKALENDFLGSREINNLLYPLNVILFAESNPIPVKAAMYLSGLIDSYECRLPLVTPSKNLLKNLEKILEKYEVKK